MGFKKDDSCIIQGSSFISILTIFFLSVFDKGYNLISTFFNFF